MPEFLNVLHVYTKCDDEVAAIAVADDIKIALERDILEPDDGEACDVVQTIPSVESPTPSAQIIQLRRARNILIRTRIKENYDMARGLDQCIHSLRQRIDQDFGLVNYDWSKFLQVTKEVLDGNNPLEY